MTKYQESRIDRSSREENERVVSALFLTMSKDLSSPLISIMAASSSLLDESRPLSEEYKHDLLLLIGEKSTRLHRSISILLELAKFRAGVNRPVMRLRPLGKLTGSAVASLDHAARIRVFTAPLPAGLPLVNVDEAMLANVLIALLENAHKYSPHDTPIRILTAIDRKVITVSVSDEGPGIAPGEEQEIFDPFYSGGTSASKAFDTEGACTGLNLVVCRAIIEAHGGLIWAENGPSGGAVLRFTLPVMRA